MKSGIYPDERRIIVDNYTLDLWRTCPRKFFWRIAQELSFKPSNILEVTPQTRIPLAPALAFGIAIHKALDTLHLGGLDALPQACEDFLDIFGDTEDPKGKRTPGRGVKLLKGYAKQWAAQDLQRWEILQCEARFATSLGSIPIHTPSNTTEEWEILYHGALDKIRSRRDNPTHINILDHKTTSWVTEHTMTAFTMSNQFYGYLNGLRSLLGTEPKNSSFTIDLLVMNARSDRFDRKTIHPTAPALQEWQMGIRETCRHILHAHFAEDLDEPHLAYPRYAPTRCTDYGKLCDYWDLCETVTDPTLYSTTMSAQFYVDPWDPETR